MEVKAKVDKRLSGKDGNGCIVLINTIINIFIIIIITNSTIIIIMESQRVSSGSLSRQHPGLGPDSCLMVPTSSALQCNYTLQEPHCNALHIVCSSGDYQCSPISVGPSTAQCSGAQCCCSWCHPSVVTAPVWVASGLLSCKISQSTPSFALLSIFHVVRLSVETAEWALVHLPAFQSKLLTKENLQDFEIAENCFNLFRLSDFKLPRYGMLCSTLMCKRYCLRPPIIFLLYICTLPSSL